MRRRLLQSIAFLALTGAAGCSWLAWGGAPLTPERRAALVQALPGDGLPPLELFTTETPVRLLLEADFLALDRDRSRESEEIPGRVIVAGGDGRPVEIPVEVKTRGNFRLRPDICSLPPLRLDFPSQEVFGTPFDGQDKLKLVTVCRDRGGYDQNLLEEYLAYRLYNLVTDASFRVQRVEITYLDTVGEHAVATRAAFLIEDDEALAARLHGRVLDVPGMPAETLAPRELGLMYLFQYMIGNTDWSTGGGHNMEFVQVGDSILAIPYDFDFSGLVDAPYAGPAPSVADQIRSVRDRLYRGYCLESIDHPAVLARFQEVRGEMLALVNTLEGLSFASRLRARRYLQEFFEDLGYPHRVEENIIRACRR